MNEDEIEKKAVEEILLEASTSRNRADELGVVGWKRSRYVTNKRFLFNTLASAVGVRRLTNSRIPTESSSSKNKDTRGSSSSTNGEPRRRGDERSNATRCDHPELESDQPERSDRPTGDGKLRATSDRRELSSGEWRRADVKGVTKVHTKFETYGRKCDDGGSERVDRMKRYDGRKREESACGNDSSPRTSKKSRHDSDRRAPKSDISVYDVNDYINLNRKALKR